MKRAGYSLLLLLCLTTSCGPAADKTLENTESSFKFAFLTDIDLNKGDNDCYEGLKTALDSAKDENIDFVITGGDNVDIDVLKDDKQTAVFLYEKFNEICNASSLKIYPAPGNHDYYRGANDDPLNGPGMFSRYLGKPYYSFDHKGWHFVILDTASSVVGEEQTEWIKKDLLNVDKQTPIIIVCHIPFVSLYYQALEGKERSGAFRNAKNIWNLFAGHNLKLVLQGHQHLYEELKILNVQFITAGAVSASWWNGPYHGTEEGFLVLTLKEKGDFSWYYKDFGWDAEKRKKEKKMFATPNVGD